MLFTNSYRSMSRLPGKSLSPRITRFIAKWMCVIAVVMEFTWLGSSSALAGNVFVQVAGDVEKTVIITGDDAGNVVDVQYESTNGSLMVTTQLGSGTIISGDTQIPMFSGRVILNLGSGNDSVRILLGVYGEDIDYQVQTGRGDDIVFVSGGGASLRNLDIDTGVGADSVFVETLASGNVVVSTGDGKDWIEIAACSVNGDLLVSTGRQNDTLTVEPGVSVGSLLGLAGNEGGRDALFLPTDPQDLSYGAIDVSGFERFAP